MAARRAARRDQEPDPDPDWAGMAGLPEKTMNGWVLQFYFHRAIEAYRSGRNRDFRQFRDIMQGARAGPGSGGAGGGRTCPGLAGCSALTCPLSHSAARAAPEQGAGDGADAPDNAAAVAG